MSMESHKLSRKMNEVSLDFSFSFSFFSLSFLHRFCWAPVANRESQRVTVTSLSHPLGFLHFNVGNCVLLKITF